MSGALELIPVPGLPEIAEGDDLAALIAEAARLADGDVVAVAQKVVSKAEGRRRLLAEVAAGERARELAAGLDKDPALVELVLAESRRIVRAERVLIVETTSGLVCANAGIDSSNAGAGGEEVFGEGTEAGADFEDLGPGLHTLAVALVDADACVVESLALPTDVCPAVCDSLSESIPVPHPPSEQTISRNARSFMSITRRNATRRMSMSSALPQ